MMCRGRRSAHRRPPRCRSPARSRAAASAAARCRRAWCRAGGRPGRRAPGRTPPTAGPARRAPPAAAAPPWGPGACRALPDVSCAGDKAFGGQRVSLGAPRAARGAAVPAQVEIGRFSRPARSGRVTMVKRAVSDGPARAGPPAGPAIAPAVRVHGWERGPRPPRLWCGIFDSSREQNSGRPRNGERPVLAAWRAPRGWRHGRPHPWPALRAAARRRCAAPPHGAARAATGRWDPLRTRRSPPRQAPSCACLRRLGPTRRQRPRPPCYRGVTWVRGCSGGSRLRGEGRRAGAVLPYQTR
jgi:hypothetical protein